MADQHRKSRAQEERVAKKYNGSRSIMSGAGHSRKNDVRNEKFLTECKRTDNRSSITIKAADLESLRRHAIVESRTPALQFDLAGRYYWVFDDADLYDLGIIIE